MVYVLEEDGKPLMPTKRHGQIRHLLKEGKAAVVQRTPFTIRLLYKTQGRTQPVTLGVDAGSKHIGLSASTETKELYSGQADLRTDIMENLSTRREFRRSRRNRNTRYRAPRFDNRTHAKKAGWLAPSVKAKCEAHLTVIRKVMQILPVTEIVIETAAFDIQKLKADLKGLKRPEGDEYQHGEMEGFWNCREYILWRDGHQCRNCHGKSGDKVLNVHHIVSRKTGGDAPDNLVTLCETCHAAYHRGKIRLLEDLKKPQPTRDASFIGIMRWSVVNRLKEACLPEGISVRMTYGYKTKDTRIKHGLPKEHRIDALCIAGHPEAERASEWFLQKKVRCHNRQIHKAKILSGGIRKRNQSPYLVNGFRLNDVVHFAGNNWFIHSRRVKGAFRIQNLNGTYLEIMPSKLTLVGHNRNYLIERRICLPA